MASEAEVYGALTEIFHDVFMRDDIVLAPELSAKQVQGWDSFKQIVVQIRALGEITLKSCESSSLDRC